jgi:hypothetical protein
MDTNGTKNFEVWVNTEFKNSERVRLHLKGVVHECDIQAGLMLATTNHIAIVSLRNYSDMMNLICFYKCGGTHYATNPNVKGSIPDEVIF